MLVVVAGGREFHRKRFSGRFYLYAMPLMQITIRPTQRERHSSNPPFATATTQLSALLHVPAKILDRASPLMAGPVLT